MNTTDREELKDVLRPYLELTGWDYDNLADEILVWHEQKVAEAVSKDKILNNPDEFVDYIKTKVPFRELNADRGYLDPYTVYRKAWLLCNKKPHPLQVRLNFIYP